MNARNITAAGVLTAGVLIGVSLPLFAHEGHGKGEVAPYDLDTPRKVSPETAAHRRAPSPARGSRCACRRRNPEAPAVLVHGSCVGIGGRGVLLRGPPGGGKSDLALRLIDGGAVLVADDQVALTARDGALFAAPPETIAGKIEARGIGIMNLPHDAEARVALVIDLHVPGRHPPLAQLVQQTASQIVAADASNQYAAAADDGGQLIGVDCHVDRRAAEHLAIGKDVEVSFAQPDDRKASRHEISGR